MDNTTKFTTGMWPDSANTLYLMTESIVGWGPCEIFKTRCGAYEPEYAVGSNLICMVNGTTERFLVRETPEQVKDMLDG